MQEYVDKLNVRNVHNYCYIVVCIIRCFIRTTMSCWHFNKTDVLIVVHLLTIRYSSAIARIYLLFTSRTNKNMYSYNLNIHCIKKGVLYFLNNDSFPRASIFGLALWANISKVWFSIRASIFKVLTIKRVEKVLVMLYTSFVIIVVIWTFYIKCVCVVDQSIHH